MGQYVIFVCLFYERQLLWIKQAVALQFQQNFSGLPQHGYADGLKKCAGDKDKPSKSSSNLPQHFHTDSPAQGSAVVKTQ